DFYGAMDGASKFIRGDAVAGILILLINIIGGIVIGTLDLGMSLGDAGRVHTLLTIGDGLVAQIPALLLSTAVAIIVTRMSRAAALSDQVLKQLFHDPRSLTVAGVSLAIIGVLPGMPNLMFLTLAALAIGGGRWLGRPKGDAPAAVPAEPALAPQAERELAWDDLTGVDLLGLEVGY